MKNKLKLVSKRLNNKLDSFFLSLGSNSSFWASFYYFLINSSFHREHVSVIQGKIKYLSEIKSGKGNLFLLTRNIHRIEKGLLMRPRRAVFAKDYIKETIDSFESVWNSALESDNLQLKWYNDVLLQYFNLCSPNDSFIKSHEDRFIKITTNERNFNCDSVFVPYKRQVINPISYDELYILAKQRRSVRWFSDIQVPRELIDKAIAVANLSPTACNRQPYEFRIIDDPNLLSEIIEYPMGTKGYGHSIKAMVIIVGNLDAYFDERDRHIIYIDASLASMSFMFALETLGLGSCAINWPDIEPREKKMEKFLELKRYQRPIMCIGIGYPDKDGLVASSEKKPINIIRKYNYE